MDHKLGIFLASIAPYLLKISLSCSYTSHQTYIRVSQLTTLLTEDIFPDWNWHGEAQNQDISTLNIVMAFTYIQKTHLPIFN